MPGKKNQPDIRNRVRELRHIKASELTSNPRNWRKHPKHQRDAMRGVLAEIGYADALIAREMPDGTFELLDGHLRKETTPDARVPVLIVDLDDAEAMKLLATHDPLAAMAEAEQQQLDAILDEIEFENESVSNILRDHSAEVDSQADGSSEETELRELSTKPPPDMTWVLIGIPTVRFGEIASFVDSVSHIESTIVEMTSNDRQD